MSREVLNFWAGLLVALLVCLVVLAPQAVTARIDASNARAEYSGLVDDIDERCDVKRDGSGTCPAGTFPTVEVATRGPVR